MPATDYFDMLLRSFSAQEPTPMDQPATSFYSGNGIDIRTFSVHALWVALLMLWLGQGGRF